MKALRENSVFFGNTESRKAEFVAVLDKAISDRKLGKHDALKLQGRLQFSSGQVFGRVVELGLASITQHAYENNGSALNEETLLLLRKYFFTAGDPRHLRSMCSTLFFIQTDAHFEWNGDEMVSGIGAVLFDFKGRISDFFLSSFGP